MDAGTAISVALAGGQAARGFSRRNVKGQLEPQFLQVRSSHFFLATPCALFELFFWLFSGRYTFICRREGRGGFVHDGVQYSVPAGE